MKHDGGQKLLTIARAGKQRSYEVIWHKGTWVRKFADGQEVISSNQGM